MADTIQVVLWALGQECPLRQGDDWEEPATAIKILADCRTYSSLRKKCEGRGFGVFGDVCVTSVTSALPGDKTSRFDYPCSGFVLSSQFASIGGLASLHRLCGDCPANDDDGIAGCVGSFHQALYSKELQEQLDRLIDRLGLASTLDSAFPKTGLHWFRFWIHSSIPLEGIAPLLQLLEAVIDEDERELRASGKPDYLGQNADLSAFVRALQRSLNGNIPIHVNLTPPGHTDLGWHTIFSHCPRCKAAAPVERWKRKYRDEDIVCAICGATFSPAKTHSAERDDWDLKELRSALGQVEFEKFAVSCLVAQGASEAEAERIVYKHEEWERARKEKWAQETEDRRRHDQFVEQVIYHGLDCLSPRNDNEPSWLFSQEDIEEIFRRVEEHGGIVLYISHVSESGEHDDWLRVSSVQSGKKLLQELREKGCNDKFSVTVKIPKEVVQRWKDQPSA